MSESVRYRIWRASLVDFYGGHDGGYEWEIGVYRDGVWSGGVCFDTFAEAVAAYNQAVAMKAAT